MNLTTRLCQIKEEKTRWVLFDDDAKQRDGRPELTNSIMSDVLVNDIGKKLFNQTGTRHIWTSTVLGVNREIVSRLSHAREWTRHYGFRCPLCMSLSRGIVQSLELNSRMNLCLNNRTKWRLAMIIPISTEHSTELRLSFQIDTAMDLPLQLKSFWL